MRIDFGLNRKDQQCEQCKTRPAYLFEITIPGRQHYFCHYCASILQQKLSNILIDFDRMKREGKLYKDLEPPQNAVS